MTIPLAWIEDVPGPLVLVLMVLMAAVVLRGALKDTAGLKRELREHRVGYGSGMSRAMSGLPGQELFASWMKRVPAPAPSTSLEWFAAPYRIERRPPLVIVSEVLALGWRLLANEPDHRFVNPEAPLRSGSDAGADDPQVF